MSLTKRTLKSRPVCKVTFRFPAARARGAERVQVIGDFNGWDTSAGQMERLQKGDFKYVLELLAGRAYRFRYLIDGERWENDEAADRYERNEFGDENSVVEC